MVSITQLSRQRTDVAWKPQAHFLGQRRESQVRAVSRSVWLSNEEASLFFITVLLFGNQGDSGQGHHRRHYANTIMFSLSWLAQSYWQNVLSCVQQLYSSYRKFLTEGAMGMSCGFLFHANRTEVLKCLCSKPQYHCQFTSSSLLNNLASIIQLLKSDFRCQTDWKDYRVSEVDWTAVSVEEETQRLGKSNLLIAFSFYCIKLADLSKKTELKKTSLNQTTPLYFTHRQMTWRVKDLIASVTIS